MLQDSLSKIKYLLVLAFLLVIPMQAKAGIGLDNIDQTDTGANRLIYYYDTVGRSTIIQLTNTSDSLACVHIQIFKADVACAEFDTGTCLTPGQTITANVETDLPDHPDLTNSHGFIAISEYSGPDQAMIGMFRIIDDNGYEYRTNAASDEDPLAFVEDFNVLNFNNVNGNDFSDVIGITYEDLGDFTVAASPFLGTLFGEPGFEVLNVGEFENANSCSPVLFTCDDATINRGIDNSIPNSQGYDPICFTSKLADNDSGFLALPFIDYVCIDPDGTPEDCGQDEPFIHFVGFLGLNNGSGAQGSMDSWMSAEFFGVLASTSE